MTHENIPESGSEVDSLLRAAQTGDQSAAQRLLDYHRSRLEKMITMRMDRRIRARFDASDVLQETMMTANARLPAYLAEPTIPFYLWLRNLALQQLIQMHRHHVDRQKRTVTRESFEHPGLSDESVLQLVDRLVGSVTGPQERLVRKEVKQRTLQVLKSLKPRDREIIELRYLEELNSDEIAAVLGIGVAAVHARHFRAIQRLGQRMDSC